MINAALQIGIFLYAMTIADKIDYIYDQEEHVSILYALLRYILFCITNVASSYITYVLYDLLTHVVFRLNIKKPFLFRMFVESVLLGHMPVILSGIADIANSNLTLIRAAHFVSCLVKILIYIDLFNHFLFRGFVEKRVEQDFIIRKLSPREMCRRAGLFLLYSLLAYFCNFFPFTWLPLDFLAILVYDLCVSKHFERTLDLEGARAQYLQPIVEQRMTYWECILCITGIKFAFFSLKYLLISCGFDVATLLSHYLQTDRIGSAQNLVNL
jgi:hypothetical protein